MCQRFAQFLIIQRMGNLTAPALAGVEGVYRFFPQAGGQLLQRGRLLAAQEDGAIAVANDGVGVVLVNGLELALRLQHQTGGDLPASDGSHEFFQLGYLPDVGALVYKTPHMDRQSPAVHIVRLFAQEIE